MTETQIQFTAYQRPHALQPDSEIAQVESLAGGYFGLNVAYLANLGLLAASQIPELSHLVLAGACLTIAVVAAVAYPFNARIASGKGWGSSSALVASLVQGVLAPLGAGLLAIFGMQWLARTSLLKLGVRGGVILSREDIEQALRRMHRGTGCVVQAAEARRW